MKQYLKALLPSSASAIATFILPVVLTVYFVVSQYSDRFILEQNVTYFDVQSNWLGQVFLNQQWLEWFNRFMDFAFWGILAAIVLIIVWAVSSTKVALKNHYTQQSFTNFSQDRGSWHGHFFTVLVLKFLLVILMVYSILAVVGKQIPELSAGVTNVLQAGTSFQTVKLVVIACLLIAAYQLVIITAVKIFKHLGSE